MADASTQARRKRLILFAVGGLALIAVVAVVIAVSGGGGKKTATGAGAATTKSASGVSSSSSVAAEFNGIPQKGNELGSPGARTLLVVFGDLQCPFCAQFENSALPQIVDRYVRPGKLKVVFEPIVIIGQDSVLGARAAAAAAQQNKMFEFSALVYRNQGQENSGYMNAAYVRKIAAAVPGLDAKKLVAELKAAPVNKLLNNAQTIATNGKVSATPTFFVAKRGQALQQFQATSLTAAAFTGKLDALTR